MSTKAKLKISFFESELSELIDFEAKVERIRVTLKQMLMDQIDNPAANEAKLKKLKEIQLLFRTEIKYLQQSVLDTRQKCDLNYDEAKVEGDAIFSSLELKVEQLNERLFIAETSVQYAQGIKRKNDMNRLQYQMSNLKGWKHEKEIKAIKNYINSQSRVISQFVRSIQLVSKVKDRMLNRDQTSNNNQLLQLLAMKNANVGYREMRTYRMFQLTRKAKSLQRFIDRSQDLIAKKQKQPLLSLLLKSPGIPYKTQREIALMKVIRDLRIKNKEQATQIKQLERSLALKDREEVLRYLQDKSSLNEEQSIRKVELMHQKFESRGIQRMLGLKLGKPSKGDQVVYKKQQTLQKYKHKSKSLQTVKKQEQPNKQSTQRKTTCDKKSIKPVQNPSLSKTKTNDSLSRGQILC